MTGPRDEPASRLRVMLTIFSGGSLEERDEPRGVREATAAAAKIGEGLIAGIASGLFLVVGAPAMSPDSRAEAVWIALAVTAGIVYAAGLLYALRARRWLKRRFPDRR